VGDTLELRALAALCAGELDSAGAVELPLLVLLSVVALVAAEEVAPATTTTDEPVVEANPGPPACGLEPRRGDVKIKPVLWLERELDRVCVRPVPAVAPGAPEIEPLRLDARTSAPALEVRTVPVGVEVPLTGELRVPGALLELLLVEKLARSRSRGVWPTIMLPPPFEPFRVRSDARGTSRPGVLGGWFELPCSGVVARELATD
jgi:hypothetical protein